MNILFLLEKYLESKIRKIFMTLPKKANALVSADQFEKLRNKSIFSFQLDSAHYSAPGYSWDMILKFTRVNLKPISDIEKY